MTDETGMNKVTIATDNDGWFYPSIVHEETGTAMFLTRRGSHRPLRFKRREEAQGVINEWVEQGCVQVETNYKFQH